MNETERKRRIRVLTRQVEEAHRVLAETFTALHELHMERGQLMFGPDEEKAK